jgi:hypothetical protein
MRSKELLFCVTAIACIAVAADASAETRRNDGKQMRAAAGPRHAATANQQDMSMMRANTGNRGFAEDRTYGTRNRVATTRGNRLYMTTGYVGPVYAGYRRVWRGGEPYVSGAGAQTAAMDIGLSVNNPGYYYDYPTYAYGYNYGAVGLNSGGLYAYAPGYSYTSTPQYSAPSSYSYVSRPRYAPRYSVANGTAGLYAYAPGESYTSTPQYAAPAAYSYTSRPRPLYSNAPGYYSNFGW